MLARADLGAKPLFGQNRNWKIRKLKLPANDFIKQNAGIKIQSRKIKTLPTFHCDPSRRRFPGGSSGLTMIAEPETAVATPAPMLTVRDG